MSQQEQVPVPGCNTKKIVTKQGNGPAPSPGQTISVHCTGRIHNGTPGAGKKFWSTKDPGQQIFTFKVGVGQVITGWDKGCLSMKEGEHATLICPGDEAYGPSGFPAWGIPPNATLEFDIEVQKIQ